MKKFLSQNKVFRLEELDEYLSNKGTANRETRKSLLRYYTKQGRIIQIRRGLYYVSDLEGTGQKASYDAHLIAAKIKPDAVLGYHTALEYYGKASTVFFQYHYLSHYRIEPIKFRSNTFLAVKFPRALVKKGKEMFGVATHKRDGVDIRVTNFERTFVDILDRPELSGGWEEVWQSLENIEYFNLDQVLEYVQILDKAILAAKVGYFLEHHRERLMVEEKYLNMLQEFIPKTPHYLGDCRNKKNQMIKKWNIIVPLELVNKTWEEIS